MPHADGANAANHASHFSEATRRERRPAHCAWDAAHQQERIEGTLEFGKAALREKREEATFASHLQILGVRNHLNCIDRLASQTIGSAENLHGADEVKLLDRGNNDHDNVAAFQKFFVLAVALRRFRHGFAHYASQTAGSTRGKQSLAQNDGDLAESYACG